MSADDADAMIAKLSELYSRDLGPEPAEPAPAPQISSDEMIRRVLAAIAQPVAAPAAPRRERAKLYDPKRRGYMRATIEEGVRAEIDAMNAEARGTPFYDEAATAAPAPRPAGLSAAAPWARRVERTSSASVADEAEVTPGEGDPNAHRRKKRNPR